MFTEQIGVPLWQYMLNKRLDLGKKLLRETLLPISAVAEQCSFNDSNYFSRAFKKSTNISPLQYRKQYLNLSSSRIQPIPCEHEAKDSCDDTIVL